MTKTKAKTTKAASKKTAAPKKATTKTVAEKAATKTKPAKKASSAKSAAKKAAPAAPTKVAKATKAEAVVEIAKPTAEPKKAKAQPARVEESKPAADFGAGLAAPRESAKPVARPEAAKPAPRAEPAKPVARPEPHKPVVAAKPEAQKPAPALDAADHGEVADFLRSCDHARAADFALVRKLILEASSSIEEGIKWNAPSFRTSEWFATFHLREPNKVAIVFHLGAKKRETAQRIPVGAPDGMVEWLAPDRCMVTVDDVKRRGKALQAFVRGWILHV